MDLDAFWKLIAEARLDAAGDNDFLTTIKYRLQRLTAEDLIQFEIRFNTLHAQSYNLPLWGAAYVMNGGCSDDAFDDFRSWLIAQGRVAFEKACEDPDTLALTTDGDFGEFGLEEFAYLAGRTYEEKIGKEMPDEFRIAVEPELGVDDWNFDDAAEMKKRYPKLYAKYGRGYSGGTLL